MDLQSRIRREDYTKVKEETFARTNIAEAPRFVVEGSDKKRAPLNCIHHLLEHIPYEDVAREHIRLPDRVFGPDSEREVLPEELYVPKHYGVLFALQSIHSIFLFRLCAAWDHPLCKQ